MRNWQNQVTREWGAVTVSIGSQAPAKRAFKTSRLHFEVGKILLAERGWWQHAADRQMHKSINKITLALKNCVTTWEEQPLSISGTAPGQEITASVLQALSILSLLCFLSLRREDETSQLRQLTLGRLHSSFMEEFTGAHREQRERTPMHYLRLSSLCWPLLDVDQYSGLCQRLQYEKKLK